MKQGMGKTTSDYKTEPKSHAVSPAAVSEIGIHQVRTSTLPLYEGRGLQAPMNECKSHKCGSQGKY